ncbi:MAG TPA: hypothetical protein VFK06_07855 [Candidatus Angelobacter sp.]|nr:hypothetical protein [Candidatus Angelobacter sp.]
MRRKFRLMIALIMALMVAAGVPAAAQKQSGKSSSSSHVSLIARMTETMSFAVNDRAPSGAVAGPVPETSHQVANSITTSWVLAKGRTQVVTLARVKRPPSPILVALAEPYGLPGTGESTVEGFSGFHLPSRPVEQISRLDSLTITNANLAATSTICLSDSINPEETPVHDDGYAGMMKIQVQALP